jgi:thymidine phosphorylase
VGFTELAPLGAHIHAGQLLAMVHARNDAAAQRAVGEVLAAYTVGDVAPASLPMVYQRIGA